MKNALSAIDLAALLDCDVRTLRRWQKNKTGPKVVIENLQPIYPIESLRKWLRVHRPDVKIGAVSEDEKKRKAESAAWDKFFADCEEDKKRQAGYNEACTLDDEGDHAGADKVLLDADITAEVVKQRRAHLNWKAANAMSEATTLSREDRKVAVLDGDRPGHYILPIYHEADCRRWASGKPEGECSCDCSFGAMEFLYGFDGPS